MSRPSNPEQQQQRRAEILQAAWRCFAQHGIAGTRTAHLCQEAGMSPGHLFHYFQGKSAIIAAALELDLAAAAPADAAPLPAWAALQAWLQQQWRELHDPVAARLTLEILALSAHDPVVAQAVQAYEAQRHARLCVWLEQAERDGAVRLHSDAAQAAQWILLLLDGSAGRVMAQTPWQDAAVLRQALGQCMQPAPELP
ncbi:MAG: TetR/AcrR family transcriptional regulator [Rhodoferax sp.]